MPGTVIGKSQNLGYVGKISRNVDNIVSSRFVKSILDGNGAETLSAIVFGRAAVLNTDNSFSKFGQAGTGVSAATAANFAGIAVGEVKQMTSYGNVSSAGQYDPTQPCDILERGSTPVTVADGTPAAGASVYICTVAGGSIAVGDFVCATNPTGGGTAVAINAKWTTGKVDANGVAEVTLTSRNQP